MTRNMAVPRNRTRVWQSKFLNRQVQQRLHFSISPNSIFGFHRYRYSERHQEMENRGRLRVQKKKPLKRSGSGKKQLVKKFVDFLKSDTFMYSPLLSPRPYDFRSSHTLPSSAEVVELKKPIKENKLFLEQVWDYLKSDVYMYAPLVDPPHSPQEPLQRYGMIRMDVSTRRLTMKVIQPTDHSGNVNQCSEIHLPRTDISDQHTQGLKEALKHTVYQNCCSSSPSGKVAFNSQLRARS